MHRHPRRTLRRLLTQYGPTLLDNPARVDALLADLCGEYRTERFLLVYALRERVTVADQSVTYWHRLCSRRLQSRYCFSAEAAQWAADSWSYALRINPSEPSISRDKGNSSNGLHAELSDSPRRTLSKLLTDYGLDLLDDPARMNALLADLSGEFDRERFLLVHALREGIPADLLSQKRGSTASERRLTKRLQKRYGVSDKAAQWAVESWSEALHHAAPDTAPKPPREKRINLGKVLGRLSLRHMMWLGLLLIGTVALVFAWESSIEYVERGAAWLLSIPGSIEEILSHFVDHVVNPAITWVVGIPGLMALGTISGLITIKSLGLKRVWRGVTWLIGMTWLGMGKVLGRLSLRQKMWLVLCLIGIVVLGYTWQSAIAYAEWGIAWIQSVPGLIGEKLSQFVDNVAMPVTTWLVGIPGLIALVAIIGLLTVKSLGLGEVWRGISWLIRMTWLGLGKVWKGIFWLTRMTWLGLGKVWRGFTWLIGMTWLGLGKVWKGVFWLTRMTWLGLGKVLGRLSLRQKMWLVLGLIGIMVLGYTWQSAIVYTEWGIAWLLSLRGLIGEKLSQFIDHVAEPVITWLVGLPGLIALGTFSGLLTIKSLGLERVWKGITWPPRIIWFGLERVWKGIIWLLRIVWFGLESVLDRLSLRQKMWLGLGLIGITVLGFTWQSAVVYAEGGMTWLLRVPGLVEGKLSQVVDHVAEPAINWLVGLPGLIALGTISGLLTIESLGLKRLWRVITWPIRMIWFRLGKALGRLSRVVPGPRPNDGAERERRASGGGGVGRRGRNPKRSSLRGRL